MTISSKTDYSTLFNSLSSSSSSSSSTSSISLIDYAQIKNGSYGKLMKAYYSGSETASELTSGYSASTDDSKTITRLQSATSDLKESSEALRKTSSLYEDGNEDELVESVQSFVDDYNSMISASDSSENSKITSAASNLATSAASNISLLSKVGITINSDATLSLDEDTLKSADKETVKSIFGSNSGFGYKAEVAAANIGIYATSDANKASGLYSSDATYTASSATGSLYSSLS